MADEPTMQDSSQPAWAKAMEKRINDRIDLMGLRVTGLEQTINKLDSRIDSLEGRISGIDTRLDRLERTVNRKFAAMGAGFRMIAEQLAADTED